ncbi:hypothetical protein PDIG_88840 [Penicillium digitatum PHI26]|uniref:Uncharacterized protein n=2 Tax=Penicillium digitatum TaxID=36651 RepID=K9F630_PEND2|nr:hypothetical protein PDIP_03220 [Penicillium digitatum Pd1]EKV04509.1 hypothetical protein PDIG_88840 [Penicillium digitatum PHI26]EKV21760.1 hypothetical protein PDIP_03220 [Penicillium digitatum Pd1]
MVNLMAEPLCVIYPTYLKASNGNTIHRTQITKHSTPHFVYFHFKQAR